MKEATLTIGELAKRADVNASAIRYYERHGLLPEPEREGGQRRYTGETAQRLGVIAVAKEAGFSLGEIQTLLATTDAGNPAHRELRALAERKLPEVEALIERAERMKGWLSTATQCGCADLDCCALFPLDPA